MVDDAFINTSDDDYLNTQDDQWYAITSTLEILNSYHGNYDSSINLNLYQILQLLSTYHDNNLTIINNRLLQILTSYRVYHDHSSSVRDGKYILTMKIDFSVFGSTLVSSKEFDFRRLILRNE